MRIAVVSGHAETTRTVLRGLGDEELRTVLNVTDALRLFSAGRVEGVVVVWPEDAVDGRAALAVLSAAGPAPALLAVLAPVRIGERRQLSAAGVRYVPLPFDGVEVVSLLAGAGPAPVEGELWAGDICVDELRWTVVRQGHAVELTRREFDLLTHLVHHQWMVQSKDQLLGTVWGSPDYSHNVVEVTVSSLRRKLELEGERVVHTVHGVGYVLRPGEGAPAARRPA